MHGWCLEGEWMPLKKPNWNGHGNVQVKLRPGSEGFLGVFSNLVEFLSASTWTDGSPREPGTLLVGLVGTAWRLKVRDPNGQRYAFYVAPSFEEALQGLDVGLASDDLDWRPEKPFQKGK